MLTTILILSLAFLAVAFFVQKKFYELVINEKKEEITDLSDENVHLNEKLQYRQSVFLSEEERTKVLKCLGREAGFVIYMECMKTGFEMAKHDGDDSSQGITNGKWLFNEFLASTAAPIVQ